LLLDCHHVPDHRGIVRLGTGRVRLAQELLQQESQALAHTGSAVPHDRLAKRGEMRLETVQLLADVEAIREDRDLLSQALLVHLDATGQLLDRLLQPVALLHESLRRTFAQALHGIIDRPDSIGEEARESAAFRFTARRQTIDRALYDRYELRRISLLLIAARGDNVRQPQNGREVDRPLERVTVLE